MQYNTIEDKENCVISKKVKNIENMTMVTKVFKLLSATW